MPRGGTSKYTDKQERKADHIAEGYRKRGVAKGEAEARAWATVNKDDGGGENPGGSGRGKTEGARAGSGGNKGSASSGSHPSSDRSADAKKGWATRRKNKSA